MAASSSGSGGMNNRSNFKSGEMDSNAMEEGDLSEEGSCVNGGGNADISFEEFLRQREEDSIIMGDRGNDTLQTGNVQVDESPLKPSINRNKESLKIKLQMRRPIGQLVEQGILPAPNTPPAYACQRVKLERAKMGDFLKAKIQSRPSRSELVRQHILEETDPRVAPLLAEKQRMLKRARLADSLNDHLIHRPGPLELVQKNILHAPDESIEKAIKEGIVPFKATCEGATPGPPLPTKYICQEDDSSSDVSSPSLNLDSVSAEEPAETLAPSSVPDVPEPVVEVQNKAPIPPTPVKPILAAVPTVPVPPPPAYPFTISDLQSTQQNVGIFAVPIFGNSGPTAQSLVTQQQPVFQSSQQSASSSSSFKSRSKKISKSKSQSKPKTIKFHEYRGPGPASAQKSSSNTTEQQKRPAESSYELLLQQQQLFLQWQLEWQHRFPKILLPAVSKMSAEEKKAFCSTLQSSSSSFPSAVSHHHNLHPDSLPVQIISNPTTNSVLILSSTEPSTTSNNNTHQTLTYVPQQQASTQTQQTATLVFTTPAPPVPVSQSSLTTTAVGSKAKVESESTEANNKVNVAVPAKLNDWKVNELKAELKKRNLPVSGSKSQLVERLQVSYGKAVEQIKAEEVRENGSTSNTVSQQPELKFFIANNSTTLLNPGTLEFLQKSGILSGASDGIQVGGTSEAIPPIQPSSKSVLQLKIQQKVQQQQQARTQLNLSTPQTIKNEPGTTTNHQVNEPRTWTPSTSSTLPVKADDLVLTTTKPVEDSNTTTIQHQSEDPWVLKITETTPSSASFETCLADLLSEAISQPPSTTINHEIQQNSVAQEQQQHVKSQMVDDVLEILIRNGELPASAQDVAASSNQQAQSSSIQEGNDFKPPPAPPLPPTTFAVTLPTEISFRRLAQPPEQHREKQTIERKDSLHGITSLTKEAQEILKIREDLVTCENKSQPSSSAVQDAVLFPHHNPYGIKKETEEFMEFEDNSIFEINKRSKPLMNGDSIVIDELLTEALEFPMDTEYSDWLESFSSDNSFNNFNNHNMDKLTCEDSHNRDPLLSSTKNSTTTNTRLTILDNNLFPPVVLDHSGNNVLMMDIDSSNATTTPTTTETDLMKIRKEDNVNVNLNTVNDLWDFSF